MENSGVELLMLPVTLWAAIAIVFMFSEALLPGGIVFFLGLGAGTVALGLHLGLLTDGVSSLLTFFISSLVYILVLRSFFIRYFEGESYIQNVDEGKQRDGTLVFVVETIAPSKEGRVRYRGSLWEAQSDQEHQSGEQVVIVGQEGNTLIVEQLLDPAESAD